MALDVSAITTQLRAIGVTTSEITDANLQDIIAHVLSEYNAYRPQVRCTTITTVADQHDYDPPTGYSTIVEVLWDPAINPSTWWPLWIELAERFNASTSFDYPSQIRIFRDKLARFEVSWGGHWETIYDSSGNEKIRLLPAPDLSSVSVPVFYGVPHTIATFPQRDYSLFFDGVLAYARYAVGFKKEKGAGFRAGTYAVNRGAGEFLMNSSSTDITKWRHRLNVGGYVMRS